VTQHRAARFSLGDDFGAASVYSYLKRLRGAISITRLDGLCSDITRSDVDFALVRSITEMGH